MKKIALLPLLLFPLFLCAAPIEMTTDTFFSERAKNTVSFDDKFMNKSIKISGIVYSVEEKSDETKKPVTLYMVELTGKNFDTLFLRLFFVNKKDVLLFEKEKEAVAICVYKGKTERGLSAPSFYDCTPVTK